jgi:hypothetical protein
MRALHYKEKGTNVVVMKGGGKRNAGPMTMENEGIFCPPDEMYGCRSQCVIKSQRDGDVLNQLENRGNHKPGKDGIKNRSRTGEYVTFVMQIEAEMKRQKPRASHLPSNE